MTDLASDQKTFLQRLQRQSLGVGVAALVVCAIGGIFSPTQFFRAYLVAYLFVLGIAHGCFVVLMVYHLTGGAWGFLIRRVLEAGMRTLPLLAVLFLPVACGVGYLYLWTQPDAVAAMPGLRQKQVYLNAPFFWGRAVLYFMSWIGIAYFLNLWSRQQDQTDDPEAARALAGKLGLLSAPGLIIFGITITFAAVDWVMSLQPGFRSTIFGPLIAIGEILAGFSFTLIVMAWLLHRPPLAGMVSVEAFNDLGNLLFTFLFIWGYLNFFQIMLIWIANLPYDISWYLPRVRGGWQWVGWALFIFHFAIPFFLLLLRPVKRNPRLLAMLAGFLLFLHLVDLNYQVLPAFPNTTIAQHWMAFVMPFGAAGVWLACFVWELQRAPVLPRHDSNQESAIHFHHLDQVQQARPEEVRHA